MKITVSQFVRKAWSYIDTPQKWTKGQFHSAKRQRHCAVGAVEMAHEWATEHGMDDREAGLMATRAIHELSRSLPPSFDPRYPLISYNDRYATHEELGRVWDKTATRLEKEGK